MVGLTTIVITNFSHLNVDDIEIESKHWRTLKTCKANMKVNLIPIWKSKKTLIAKKIVEDIPCFVSSWRCCTSCCLDLQVATTPCSSLNTSVVMGNGHALSICDKNDNDNKKKKKKHPFNIGRRVG
jgi:hypothetical protein